MLRFVPRGFWVLSALVLVGCSQVSSRSADRFTESGELVALSGGAAGGSNACFTCHGLDGRGNGAGAPRLAGLDLGYLDKQLNNYASGIRQHPEMEWIARRLSATDRHAVSAYYALMPFETAASAALPMEGRGLYLKGDPARGLAACATCHGAQGEGIGPANPPLAGQPAVYLAEQLESWRRSERRNDPNNIMLRISLRLTPREVAALSAYAAALGGRPPNLERPAASPGARRADPRNDASAPPPRGPGSAAAAR